MGDPFIDDERPEVDVDAGGAAHPRPAITADLVRRTVGLDCGRTLEIRRVGPADCAGLEMLYRGLDDDARCLRFFSMYRPPSSFFEKLTTVAERDGAGLVAVVVQHDGAARLVGEGSVEHLPNGNGEFALTVDRAWRGWLGAYLLDALVEEAAARGMRNLEAEILTRNRPMLALVKARGYVVVPSPDWTQIRVVIGAAGTFPTWPEPHATPRVLVEGPGSAHWDSSREFPGGSAAVLACAGPGRHLRCPALDGRACPLAADADLIVLTRPPDDDEWRSITTAHQVLHPGVPVHLERELSGTSTRS